jgi:membrane associated rhomboid family serine protease
MQQASVGFQCPECVQQGAKSSPHVTARSILDRRPTITYGLIGINALALLYVLSTGGTIMDGGGTGTINYGLVAAGQTSVNSPIVGVASGEWYRLITGGFLHAGVLHFGMNMFALWIVGTQLERILGAVKYLTLYMVSLLAGGMAVMMASPDVLTVGASGAIFGLFGAAAAFQRSRGINVAMSGLGGLILLNLLITFAIPGISVAGHIGGLIGGLVFGFVIFELERLRQPDWVVVAIGAALCVGMVFGGIWAAQHYLTTGHAVL